MPSTLGELIELVEETNSDERFGPDDVRGISNLKEMRKVISQCVSPQCYLPKDTDIWDKAFCRYKLVTKNSL